MRKALTPATFSIAIFLLSAAALQALPPPMPLEDRVADSDLVVAGEIVKVADEPARGGPADHVRFARQVRCTVKVTQVFKGPADLKEVEVLCPKPSPPPKAPPGIGVMRTGMAFRKAEVGEKAIWALVKNPTAEGSYKELYYHPMHEQDKAEAVAAVAKVAADPAKVLKDDKAAGGPRLSAAYLFLRHAVPEALLPQVHRPADPNMRHMGAEPDTSGHTLLDAALVDRAVDAAVWGLANTDDVEGKAASYPGPHGLGLKALQGVVRDLRKLRPEQEVTAKQRSREQMIEDTRQQRKAWAEAVRTWCDKHKTKLYVPKHRPPVMPVGRGA